MSVFIDKGISSQIKDKYIFLDNDFLSEIFNNKEVFLGCINFFSESKCHLLIDPHTEFEFLRDVYVPEQRILKEKFINKEIFSPATNHQNIYSQLQDNALLLSKIYAHQNKSKGCSYVDLFLAARLMLNYTNSLLLTGNKKDFSSCIFDIVGIVNTEQNNETIKSYSLIYFNKKKFLETHSEIQTLEEKYYKELKD